MALVQIAVLLRTLPESEHTRAGFLAVEVLSSALEDLNELRAMAEEGRG